MQRLRFGILGVSPGNGHPYSWSAIFNGYEPAAMADCPFPAIPEYLSHRSFPDDAIPHASVTHIWTQDRQASEHIAAATRISTVVDDPASMIGKVDAILLARDDADTHYSLAAPFLDAKLPIYIDKPLALSTVEANRLYSRQNRPGQIFTCSALAYASEFALRPHQRAILGDLRFVEAVTIKDWNKYAVHVIEPLLRLVNDEGDITRMTASGRNVRRLNLAWSSGLEGCITALGSPIGHIAIRLYGTSGWREMVFRDTFTAFRAALRDFTDIVAGRKPPQNPHDALKAIRLIEAGLVPP